LHTIVKMMAAARQVPASDLASDLLADAAACSLHEDPDLADLVYALLERDPGVANGLRREVLVLLDSSTGGERA
jgi:hypothetical protein